MLSERRGGFYQQPPENKTVTVESMWVWMGAVVLVLGAVAIVGACLIANKSEPIDTSAIPMTEGGEATVLSFKGSDHCLSLCFS
eukprot:SAG22_NODE_2758_length_2239_cov_1.881776_5_plen_83_part_01